MLVSFPSVWSDVFRSHRAAIVAPDLGLNLAYFGFLFPILRWWRQADPLRRSRFSLWSTAVCVLWAGLLGVAWPFPQPWGMMAAATIAISVQLSAPWFGNHRDLDLHVV